MDNCKNCKSAYTIRPDEDGEAGFRICDCSSPDWWGHSGRPTWENRYEILFPRKVQTEAEIINELEEIVALINAEDLEIRDESEMTFTRDYPEALPFQEDFTDDGEF